jgi:putative CocE/NonD family hydrolase
MKTFILSILFAAGLTAICARSEGGPARETPPSAIASTLIPGYASSARPADLTTLYRLQLAEQHFIDAEKTLDRLEHAYQSSEPRLVPALVPWRIYARAKAYAASGAPAGDALGRAFSELYATLPDTRVADILPWYSADFDRLHAEVSEQERACAGKPLASCPSAAGLIASRETLAAWVYLLPASESLIKADLQRRFLIDDRILIPTPDGVNIAAILVRPRSVQPVKLTALLNFTIYARDDWSIGDAVQMAAHGYAGIVAYTRGKGRSSGPVAPYVHDGEDATTVIAWLARQPWSDGRVGMFSGSYNGFTQWSALKHRPPALKAIATNATNAPGIDTPMQGNVFQSFIYPWPFYTMDTKGLDDATYDDQARWDRLEHDWYAGGRSYRDLDKIDGKPNPVFDTWLDHPAYDAYWQGLIAYGEEFANIDIPVFVETGYYDGGMVGALYYLMEHYKYHPSADHRLLVGPYHHTAMQTGVLAEVDGYEVDKAALVNLQAVRLAWFDHVFHGAPLPELLSDRINFEVMGSNTWRHVPSLGEMATGRQRLYLTGSRQDGRLLFNVAPGPRPPPELVVDFANRSDADFHPAAGLPDTRNALVFETDPLTKPLEVDGLFRGRLEVVINKRDFDLSVRFYELRPDGRYLDLASYLGRASYMQDRTHRHLLEPGQPRTLEFESQTLTARLLARGSRIVAVVGVPKSQSIQINYGTGRNVSDESIVDAGKPLIVRWSAGSYLDIGVR